MQSWSFRRFGRIVEGSCVCLIFCALSAKKPTSTFRQRALEAARKPPPGLIARARERRVQSVLAGLLSLSAVQLGRRLAAPAKAQLNQTRSGRRTPVELSPEFRTGEARSRAGRGHCLLRQERNRLPAIKQRIVAGAAFVPYMVPNSRDFALPNHAKHGALVASRTSRTGRIRLNYGPILAVRLIPRGCMASSRSGADRSPKPALNGGQGFRIVKIRH